MNRFSIDAAEITRAETRHLFHPSKAAPHIAVKTARSASSCIIVRTSTRFVVVHVHALELKIGITDISTVGTDPVLIANHLRSRRRRRRPSVSHHSRVAIQHLIQRHDSRAFNRSSRAPTSQNLAPIWLPH